MMTDPIADFLSRIRNALMAGHKVVSCPCSKLKVRIAQILRDEGYISDFSVEMRENQKVLVLTMRYDGNNRPVIEGVARMSRPGLRMYKRADELSSVRGGMGMSIVSTSRGVMSDHQARRMRVGGEVLCTVW